MDKAFEDILKGSIWENISEYLYNSLREIAMPDEAFDVRKSLKHKIDLCESIIACSKKTFPVTVGTVTLTEEQSSIARDAIKKTLIAEYDKLGMDMLPISTEEALRMLKMGVGDNWIRELYLEWKDFCELEINYHFISRHIDNNVADLYVDYLIENSPYNTVTEYPMYSEGDMKNVLSCLRYVLSLFPKGRPKNDILQRAIELFFERCGSYTAIYEAPDDIVGAHCITYFSPSSFKHVWFLYYPHTNKEYLTIYQCLDYFDLISNDIKVQWEKVNSNNPQQSYIKKFVSMLKEKHFISQNKEQASD